MSDEYFEITKFEDYCGRNFEGLEQKIIAFYDEHFEEIIRFALEFSNFPENEWDQFYAHYKGMMDSIWRPNAMEYLQPVTFE